MKPLGIFMTYIRSHPLNTQSFHILPSSWLWTIEVVESLEMLTHLIGLLAYRIKHLQSPLKKYVI